MNFGYIEKHPLKSEALQGNRFNDPAERLVTIYIPPGYNGHSEKRYPVLYLLPSHGNTGEAMLNWKPWGETMEQRLDRLMGLEGMPPALVVMPDMWTRLGGSQYLNSAVGKYEDYFIKEIVPFVDQHYRTSQKRGVLGHSSGGYGALVYAMRYPQLFGAVAAHAADMYWEFTCLPAIARLHQGLTKFGKVEQFLEDIEYIQPKGGGFWELLMTLCWTLAHGANPEAPLGFDLPIDLETGALNEQVWARWLTFDPLRMLDQAEHQTALRGMKQIYIAAGVYDEYQLQVGARLFSKKLKILDITHIHEEQPIGHSGSDVPYDRSITLLVKSLAEESDDPIIHDKTKPTP